MVNIYLTTFNRIKWKLKELFNNIGQTSKSNKVTMIANWFAF